MSRTGASTARTTKPSSKTSGRTRAAKPAAPAKKSAPHGGQRSVRAESVTRHGIRTPQPEKASASRSGRPRSTAPHADSEAPLKRQTSPAASADQTKTMRKTTANKAKSTTDEKEKRSPAPPPEPPVAKAAPPAKEPKVRATKTAAPPAAEDQSTRRKRGADEDAGTTPRAKSGRGSRSKSFGFDDELMQDYVGDDETASEELDDELAIEPMELPLELLDPELVEVPRPAAAPKPKPKPVTGRRQQTCANCHNTYGWLSVDGLCFNCLKKKLAQRKREDETYPGFTGEAEEEEDAS